MPPTKRSVYKNVLTATMHMHKHMLLIVLRQECQDIYREQHPLPIVENVRVHAETRVGEVLLGEIASRMLHASEEMQEANEIQCRP